MTQNYETQSEIIDEGIKVATRWIADEQEYPNENDEQHIISLLSRAIVLMCHKHKVKH